MSCRPGAAGGLFRDILSAEVPLLFRKSELYATASMAGGIAYLWLQWICPRPWAAGIGALIVIAIRFAAMRWQLTLPVFRTPKDPREE